MEKLIHDFDGTEDYFCSDKIEVLCRLENAELIACKIVRDFGYTRKEPHTPNPKTSYVVVEDLYEFDDLYEFIEGLIESEDSKNGVQIYQDTDTEEYYLQITGAVFFDKLGKPVTEDKVKVYFKEFVW